MPSSLIICYGCRLSLPSLPESCSKCAAFLCNAPAGICGNCLANPPPFDRIFAVFPYEFPIVKLIIQLKFQHQLSHARAFGQLFVQKIQSDWYKNRPLPQVILPIPLHPQRLRERGFNQALEIARPISKALSIPLDVTGAMRIKPTLPQSSLTARERRQNLAQAFAMKRDYAGLRVAVIDDVMTTGSTITEFCRLLRAQGVKSIDVWCCARRG